MNIGTTIKLVRKRKRISQQELAERCGISQTYISILESSRESNPSIHVLKKISKALDLPYPVLAFLTLEYDDISQNKQDAYKRIEPAIDALIKEFFLA